MVPSEAEGKPPEMRTFLLPRSDYRIDDNWHVAGLKGTGSKDIVVEDAFVPEHRTHRLIDGFKRQSPGNAVNPAPLYRLPFGQVFVRSVSTQRHRHRPGRARRVPRHRREARRRRRRREGRRGRRRPRLVAARAAATIDEVRLVLHRNLDEMMALVRAGEDIPIERRVRFRHDSSSAVVKCVAAVDAALHPRAAAAPSSSAAPCCATSSTPTRRAPTTPTTPTSRAATSAACCSALKNEDYFI